MGDTIPGAVTAPMTTRALPAVIAAWQSLGTRPPPGDFHAGGQLAGNWHATGTFLWSWHGHGGCAGWRFDPGSQELLCLCGASVLEARDPAEAVPP